MKKIVSLLLVFLLLATVLPSLAEDSPAVDPCGLRGWDLQAGYQYVIMGYYPYEEDGTKAPVLWQVLGIEDGKALLFSTYIIDVHQPVEVSDRKTAENKKYREIMDYGETDLNVWLNEVMIQDLLADEPVFAAVTEEKYGRLYPLTDDEMMTEAFGFTSERYWKQPSRWAYATPYTLNKKLYPEVKGYFNKVQKDSTLGTSSYWVAAVKYPDKPARYLQLCAGVRDTVGHLSYGFLARTTVGLRVALRLDTSKIQVVSGSGTIWDPCRLGYVENRVVETPPVRPQPTPVATTPAPVKDRPTPIPPEAVTTPVPTPDWMGN